MTPIIVVLKEEQKMTTVAIVAHPRGDERHPVSLASEERAALRKTLNRLNASAGENPIAVIASPSETAKHFTALVAGHFLADVTGCSSLDSEDDESVSESCECVSDFTDSTFELVVVVASRDIARRMAQWFAAETKRPFRHIGGRDAHVFVI